MPEVTSPSQLTLLEQWAACLTTVLLNDPKLKLSDEQMTQLGDCLVDAVPKVVADPDGGALLRKALATNLFDPSRLGEG